jgi:maltoporin
MGRRYYDRQMVEFTERAWLNVGEGAHFGLGFEGWQVGPGKLALAAFRHHDPDGLSIDGQRSGTVYTTSFDLRYTGITLAGEHSLSLWGGLAQRHENQDLDYLNKMGLGVGLWIDSPNLLGGQHRLVAMFIGGPLNTRSDFDATPAREEQGYALAEAGSLEIISDYQRELGDQFAVQTMLLFRNEVRGIDSGLEGDQIFWLSGGGRLTYFLSDHLSLAGELGVDNVTNEIDDTAGTLVKTTLAVQLSPSRGLFKPPVMRGFITIATWDRDFQGAVGGSVYAEDTAGWTAGVQLEHRW